MWLNFIDRLLLKLTFLQKIKGFYSDFKSICEHIIEKFEDKDPKKNLFKKKMDFRKNFN